MEPVAAHEPVRAWSTVLILFLLSTVAWVDRSVVAMVIGPIRTYFGIGDFQVSLLAGFAFVFFYVTLLVPIGWLADRFSRRIILFAGVMVWSGATALCGVVGTYGQLFAARMLVGAGEGCISPVAAAVIGRIFGRERMAAPLSLYSLGTSAGTALGAIAAGYILAWRAAAGPLVLPWIGSVEGWQLVFLLLGIPGVVVAFLAFAILDPAPPRRQASASSAADAADAGTGAVAYLRTHARAFGCAAFGFVIINVAVTGVMTWTPEYLRRRFGASPAETGWVIAAISLLAPLVCQAGVGFVVNRLMARGVTDAPLRVMRWLLVIALPLTLGLWWAPTMATFVACMFGLTVVLFPSNPLSYTAIQLIAPATLKSQLAAVHLAILGVVGIGLGSSVVGFLTQYWLGEDRLNVAMALVALVAVTLSLIVLGLGLRPVRSTIAELRAAGL